MKFQHEMTHAYLQHVHNGNIKPHGKEFKKKTSEINAALKLNITTQHNFLSWWRCDGKCRLLPLHYYGYVSGVDEKKIFDLERKEVKAHKDLCGGNFHQIEEPSSEMLLELRRIKRKRKSMLEEDNLIKKCIETEGKVSCKDCKFDKEFNNKVYGSHKMTRYSTEDEK